MRLITLLHSLFTLCIATDSISHRHKRNYSSHDYYAVHIDPSQSPLELAAHLGLEYDGRLDFLDDHHMFKSPKHDDDLVKRSIQDLRTRRKAKRDIDPHILDSIFFSQKQVLRQRLFKRGVIDRSLVARASATENAINERSKLAQALSIQDPIFDDQWHIFNTKEVGNDMNVTGVWLQGITGKNATVCIIDDGLDMDSLDLKPNYYAKGSYDFNDGSDEPKPKLSDDQHGTRCAGEVAAARNNVCGVGVAYDARISGVRILSAPIPDVDEAAAVIYGFQENDIYSCSWGPPDDGKTMDAPGLLIKKAFLKAIQEGRNGKGTIYVFAAGNGAASEDNCNFDGYTNSIYSVTIGAIDKSNSHPYYSEKCSAQLAVTYSSGAGDAIHTTDVGVNKCTNIHGGTSAAGPLVAGVYALVLQVRPDMTWRDIQWITVLTSVPFFNEESESSWQKTAMGRKFSHQFGYGKVDAFRMVELAKDWKLVKKQAWFFSPWIHVRHAIPEGNNGLTNKFTVTKEMLEEANLETIEHVTITMNVVHSRRGDISVELHSPSGIVSHLSETRKYDDVPIGYVDWTFMTVAHWGEKGIGDWTIVVKDSFDNQHTGSLTDWRIKLWGTSIDESKQGLLPMPTEHDDDDHDKEEAMPGVPGTTSVMPKPSTTNTLSATSLPVRPSIVKPTDNSPPSSTASVSRPSSTVPGINVSSSPVAIPGLDATGNVPKPTEDGHSPSISGGTLLPPAASATAGPDESFLPSPFPTFGVSKRTQIWIYGAFGLILIFCASLAAYFWWQRRKRLRNNPRDNYEFAVLDDQDETDAMLSGDAAKGRRRRAGELYDAFAGESDEELFSDEYQDEEPYYGEGASGSFNEKQGGDDDSDDEKAGLVR